MKLFLNRPVLYLLILLTISIRPLPGHLSFRIFNKTEKVRAIILVDQRLYGLISSQIDQYIELASKRRQFAILLDANKNLDDWHYVQVKDLVRFYYETYSGIEGVLFIGNIKAPSFYKTRADILQVRYYHPYYEVFNIELAKKLPKGIIDLFCKDSADYYCQNRVPGGNKIQEHDFDEIMNFPLCPDIWTAWMPAGDDSLSTHPDYARLLRPYFYKLIAFYDGKFKPEGKMYMISNDLYGYDYNFWKLYKNTENVDFYGMNPDTCTECMKSGRGVEGCFQRVRLEDYRNFNEFMSAFYSRPFMGNGWQDSVIFKRQMENNHYQFVIVNVHGREDYTLLKNFQARRMKNGGLIIMGCGCSIAGYKLPRSPSHVQSKIYPAGNILLSYLYGVSDFRAAFGTAFWRGHAPHYEIIIDHMKNNGFYLGKANLERTRWMYHLAADRYDLREWQNEFFLGDPFLDLNE